MYDEEPKTEKKVSFFREKINNNEEVKKEVKEKKTKSSSSMNFNVNWKSLFIKFGVLGIGVFAVIFISTKIGQGSENKVLEKNLESMKTSAYKYFKENEKPSEVDEEYNITLQDLIDSDFIEPLKDKKGNVCDADSSNVTLVKKTNTKYDLNAYISCNEKEEQKQYSLTYATTSSSATNNKKNVYYKLQKEVTTDNFIYSCPTGYVLSGKYCYSKASTLTTNPIAKYKTTPAKKTNASYKKPSDEYEYVDAVEIANPEEYTCKDKDAKLVGNQCVITKPAILEEDYSYKCNEGTPDGSKCIIITDAIVKDFKYKCSSGKLFNDDQCELKRDYKASYDCPEDYPHKDGSKCYYTEKADRDFGEWHYSSRQTYTREKDDDDTDYKKYEFIESYEGSNGRTKYVYKVYTRSKEYVCDESNGEDVKLKGSRCYYYIDAYADKECDNGYELNDDETKCVKYVDAKKVSAPKTYTCPDGYNKRGSKENTTCEKRIDAEKVVTTTPKCASKYDAVQNSDGTYSCTFIEDAKKTTEKTTYVCPTGYDSKGSGSNLKCFKKTTTEGYYYCKNADATLEGTKCITEAKTELTGYKCPSGYDLNGNSCIKILSGDKVLATKTNDPTIDFTYKWSEKQNESGWTWTGETKEL